MKDGWRQGRNPRADFSVLSYLIRYPDVARAQAEPFEHYLDYGAAEGRDASPLELIDGRYKDALLCPGFNEARQMFNESYYRHHHNKNIAPGADPFLHYMGIGWVCGFNPDKQFSTQFYLAENSDIRSVRIHPFAHWAKYGHAEGRPALPRLPSPPDEKPPAAPAPELSASDDSKLLSQFDAPYYRKTYPDLIEASSAECLRHYMTEGWKEGRDPSRVFSTVYYLASNPDIRNSNLIPFAHWVSAGRHEGRPGRAPTGDGVQPRLSIHRAPPQSDIEHRLQFFDKDFYLATNEDERASGVAPFL
ncbi:MAG: hypothetical protein ACK5NN_00020, partial [Sphingomonadaceae bacterium]